MKKILYLKNIKFGKLLVWVGNVGVLVGVLLSSFLIFIDVKADNTQFENYTKPEIETTATKASELSKILKRSVGKASWYDYKLEGYPNYSKENYTAASRDYPRGMKLLVCRIDKEATINDIREVVAREKEDKIFLNQPDNSTNINKCVKVRVNDYGPEEWTGNIIDLSSAAFNQLASLSKGIIEVEIIKL